MSPLGLGSDYGGSIRCPAHFCGVGGLRLGTGAIAPAEPRLRPWTAARAMLTTEGPLARSAADLALAVEALVGRLPPAGLPRRVTVVGPVRGSGVDPACAASLDTVAAVLRTLGVVVVEEAPPFHAELERAFDEVTAMETRLVLEGFLPERAGDVSPQLLGQWQGVSHLEFDRASYSEALGCLLRLQPQAEPWLNDHPVLMMLAASAPAFALGELDGVYELFDSCKLASALGLPALVVPVGQSAAGLPVGVQLVGRRGCESELVAVAREVETALAVPAAVIPASHAG
jgi:amidase